MFLELYWAQKAYAAHLPGSISNLGHVYKRRNEFALAKKYYQEALNQGEPDYFKISFLDSKLKLLKSHKNISELKEDIAELDQFRGTASEHIAQLYLKGWD